VGSHIRTFSKNKNVRCANVRLPNPGEPDNFCEMVKLGSSTSFGKLVKFQKWHPKNMFFTPPQLPPPPIDLQKFWKHILKGIYEYLWSKSKFRRGGSMKCENIIAHKKIIARFFQPSFLDTKRWKVELFLDYQIRGHSLCSKLFSRHFENF